MKKQKKEREGNKLSIRMYVHTHTHTNSIISVSINPHQIPSGKLVCLRHTQTQSYLSVSIHTKSLQVSWSVCGTHKLSDATNLKWYTYLYFYPDCLPTFTSLCLLPLAASASIMVSLLLKLIKATVLAESSCFLSVLWTFYAPW